MEKIMELTNVFETPVYECKTSKGNKKYWKAIVSTDGENYFTQTSYWQDVKTGISTKQISEPSLVIIKNVGKANETTLKDQAMSEVNTVVNKQIDKGYHLPGEKSTTLPLPMLALKYQDCKHRLEGELCVQPKLDGMRVLYDGKKMWSRAGKLIIPEVCYHLRFDTQGYTIDGELLLPLPYGFQDSQKASKKFRLNLSPLLTYVVYDIADSNLTFKERYKILKNIIASSNNSNIIICPTISVSNEVDIMKQHEKFVADGYEGTIIRAAGGLYKFKDRSKDLQKYKDFVDEEFKVIDVVDGTGKFAGVAMFRCITKENKEFDVNLKGWSLEDRKEMFKDKDKYIGQMLKVKFQRFSDDGIPIFANGIAFRDFDLEGGGEDEEESADF
jgi:DNA ligase-1